MGFGSWLLGRIAQIPPVYTPRRHPSNRRRRRRRRRHGQGGHSEKRPSQSQSTKYTGEAKRSRSHTVQSRDIDQSRTHSHATQAAPGRSFTRQGRSSKSSGKTARTATSHHEQRSASKGLPQSNGTIIRQHGNSTRAASGQLFPPDLARQEPLYAYANVHSEDPAFHPSQLHAPRHDLIKWALSASYDAEAPSLAPSVAFDPRRRREFVDNYHADVHVRTPGPESCMDSISVMPGKRVQEPRRQRQRQRRHMHVEDKSLPPLPPLPEPTDTIDGILDSYRSRPVVRVYQPSVPVPVPVPVPAPRTHAPSVASRRRDKFYGEGDGLYRQKVGYDADEGVSYYTNRF